MHRCRCRAPNRTLIQSTQLRNWRTSSALSDWCPLLPHLLRLCLCWRSSLPGLKARSLALPWWQWSQPRPSPCYSTTGARVRGSPLGGAKLHGGVLCTDAQAVWPGLGCYSPARCPQSSRALPPHPHPGICPPTHPSTHCCSLGNVDWRLAAGLVAGTLVGGVAGSQAAVHAPPGSLEVVFTVVTLVLARMTLKSVVRR